MNKLKAIEYLVGNSVYEEEWSGAGMWQAVEEVMKYKKPITEKYLDLLLKKAEEF